MTPPLELEIEDQQMIAIALGHFVSDRIDAGRAMLSNLRPEILERLYTAGIRLGIEAHELTRSTDFEDLRLGASSR